jgi:hypothetical protein
MSLKRKIRHFWIGCDCIMVAFSLLLYKLFEKNSLFLYFWKKVSKTSNASLFFDLLIGKK